MPGTLHWLRKKEAKVSAHYLVTKKGEVYQLVDEANAAWHAGRINKPSPRALAVMKKDSEGRWVNPNRYTIGIECEALQDENWTEPQMKALVALCNKIKESTSNGFNGELDRIITHRDLTSYKPNMDIWLATLHGHLTSPIKVESGDEYVALRKELSEIEGLLHQALAKIEDLEQTYGQLIYWGIVNGNTWLCGRRICISQ